MINLIVRILPAKDITPDLDRQIDDLDRLAFSSGGTDEPPDPYFASIQWSSPDWMVIGMLDDKVVSQLGLHVREVTVGGEKTRVAGVGGVATHPDWQHRGLASQVLRAAEVLMRDELKVPFGLLICEEKTQPVYRHCGWQAVALSLLFFQDGQRRTLETSVMVLPLSERPWPPGEIDLLGLPW